jgi:predicted transcriptional regulator
MYLIKVLKERNLSKLQLALETKIAPADLYCAINGKKPFYPAWRRRISEYLKVSEEELFSDNIQEGKSKWKS